MALTPKQKEKATKPLKRHDTDTGSAEYQIALFTEKIKKLVGHLKKNPKDKHSRRGLLGMVSQRKTLLKSLKNKNEETFEKVIKTLNLRG